jgi:hypothetical protein
MGQSGSIGKGSVVQRRYGTTAGAISKHFASFPRLSSIVYINRFGRKFNGNFIRDWAAAPAVNSGLTKDRVWTYMA